MTTLKLKKINAKESKSLVSEFPLDLYEPFTRPRLYPKNFNNFPERWHLAYETFSSLPQRSVYVFENAVVFNYGVIITSNNEIIYESIRDSEPEELRNIRQENDSFLYDYNGEIAISCEKVISICKPGAGNYGHWMCEMIPRMVFIKKLPQFKNHKILIHPHTKKVIHVIKQMFDYFGINESELLWRNDTPCEYAEVVFPSLWAKAPVVFSPDIGHFWKSAVASEVKNIVPTRKLFIARKKEEMRGVTNEEEIRNLLEPQGYEWCYPSSYSFVEQIKLFASAKAIIGIAAAGMTNMIFAPKNIPIILLAPQFMPCIYYFNLANQRQQDFYILFEKNENISQEKNILSNFSIDINELKHIVQNLNVS